MFNLRFAKDFLLHRFKAKNRHGLHSPFVYKLVDTVIYDFHAKKVYAELEKSRGKFTTGVFFSPKMDQLIYRLAVNLKPGHLMALGPLPQLTLLYLQNASPAARIYSDIDDHPESLDLILMNAGNKEQGLEYLQACLPAVHENTMLIFTGIYQSNDRKQAWNQIKIHPKVTVTVDLFWLGLAFFRKGQTKEDFLIKF